MFRDDLSALPNEIIQTELTQQSSISGLINLPQVSKRFRGLLFNTEDHRLALRFHRKLLSHAALGEWEQAEEIYQVFPDLVSCKGTIGHPNRTYVEGQAPVDIRLDQNLGRYKYVDRSPWQIALMNEEYEEAELMGKFMTDEEKKKQFAEIFPDGEIKKYGFDLEHAKQLLVNLMEKIAKDNSINSNDFSKMNDETRDALYAVYQYAKQNPNQIHQIGLVSDPNFYLAALTMYDNEANKKFGNNCDKYSFWCIRVEEMLASCLGTGYLRPHAQGIGNDQVHRRGCLLADGSSYFPFRRASLDFLGTHFFVGYYGAARRRATGVRALFTAQTSKLMSRKNESKDRLYATICAPKSIVMSDSLK